MMSRFDRSPLTSLILCLGVTLFAPSPWLRAAEPETPVSTAATNDALEAIFEGEVPKTAGDLREMQHRTLELVERIQPCTVGLRIGAAQGSGVIINEEGYILTAAHVIQRPGLKADIILEDGRIVQGKTYGLDRQNDAGLVKIETSGREKVIWPHLEMSKIETVKPGQWCLVLGHPGGYQSGRKPVVRLGRILALEDELIITDCTLVGGDSGGPLLDMHGDVIGIHSRIGGAITANMHVPVKYYRDGWDRLAKGEMWGDVPRGAPYIGVQGDSQSKEAKIAGVEAGHPGDRAGLKAGDIVTKFNGKEVQDFATLAEFVADSEPGDKVQLEVRRAGETLKLELTIGRRR